MFSYYLPYLALPLVLSLVLVRAVMAFLNRREILDLPNERSSHDTPTPRGGGLAVMPVIFAGQVWLQAKQILVFPEALSWMAVLGGGMFLSLVSWIDDRRQAGVHARWRLLVQLIAVTLPLLFLPAGFQMFAQYNVPLIVERVALGLVWMWFLNLYNFMDGVNAITGVETVSISLGLVVLTLLAGLPLEAGYIELNLIVAGTVLGFLFWNARPHARIFLGDIGSVGLGYLLGWVLILVAMQGNLVVALLLPLVYISDATLTIGKRTFQRKKIWEGHREHFYQQATHLKGLTHLQTAGMTLVINLLLIVTAFLVVLEYVTPLVGFAIGVVLVKILLFIFYKIGRRV